MTENLAAASLYYSSPALTQRFEALLLRWARLPWEVLILGEMGTGKSVLAERLHGLSGRAGPPGYCSLAQLAESLAMTELFGHTRWAYTGALIDRPGHFEQAHGSTLILDELGDCPMGAQGALLRVLETKQVQRVGENRWRTVDVRVIACTNADLEARVREGRFRADLLARFGEFIITLPPLRERREDILPLARRFLAEDGAAIKRSPPALDAAVERALREAPWHANIRGLRSVCRYLLAMADEVAELSHLPPRFLATVEPGVAACAEPLAVRARRVLEEVGGNKTRAAARLGIRREHLHRVLKAAERESAT